jgi:NAD-dependent dihydropyrimidine dehydrogenase PreA subunit
MPHVICEPCIGVKDRACTLSCPVDCIHPLETEDLGEAQLFINPEECIDCGACVAVCPVNAIYPEDTVPEAWFESVQKNRDYFRMPRTLFAEVWGQGSAAVDTLELEAGPLGFA